MSTTTQLPVTLIYTDVSDSLYVGRQLVATARFLSDELIDSVLREYGLPRRGPGPSQWPALPTCLNADGQLPSDLADVCVPVEFQAQLDLVVSAQRRASLKAANRSANSVCFDLRPVYQPRIVQRWLLSTSTSCSTWPR